MIVIRARHFLKTICVKLHDYLVLQEVFLLLDILMRGWSVLCAITRYVSSANCEDKSHAVADLFLSLCVHVGHGHGETVENVSYAVYPPYVFNKRINVN